MKRTIKFRAWDEHNYRESSVTAYKDEASPKVEEWNSEFNKQFPCTNLDCDGEGTYADGNCEPNPCQYCHVVRLPTKDFISSLLLQKDNQRKKEVEEARFDGWKERVDEENGFISDWKEKVVKEEQQRIIAIIDGMKSKPEICTNLEIEGGTGCRSCEEGFSQCDYAIKSFNYNQALEDLKSAILPTKS